MMQDFKKTSNWSTAEAMAALMSAIFFSSMLWYFSADKYGDSLFFLTRQVVNDLPNVTRVSWSSSNFCLPIWHSLCSCQMSTITQRRPPRFMWVFIPMQLKFALKPSSLVSGCSALIIEPRLTITFTNDDVCHRGQVI